jgi:hypothetical protein
MTLAEYRAAIRATLRDSGSSVWTDAQVDAALREALEAYSRVTPRALNTTLTLAANGREISLASVTGLLEVADVWLPYTASDPEYPANRRLYRRLTPTTLYIEGGADPASGDVLRLFYLASHTVNGLDSASATTVVAWHEQAIAWGAAAMAGRARARQLAEAENVTPSARRWAATWPAVAFQSWADWLMAIAVTQSGWVAWGSET